MNLEPYPASALLMRSLLKHAKLVLKARENRLSTYLTLTARILLTILLIGGLSAAHAQAERHGIRVRYTSIAPAGGLEGRAFLPVSSQGVSEQASSDPACKAQRMLTIHASLTRGPLRALKLRMPAAKIGRAALLESACAAVQSEVTLEDGSTLKGGQGYVELQSLPSAADPTFRGSFAQTTVLRDVPVTIEGNFVVPTAKVSTAP